MTAWHVLAAVAGLLMSAGIALDFGMKGLSAALATSALIGLFSLIALDVE